MPLQETCSLAIGATFTAEALEPVLNFWFSELGLACPIRFAGYGQVFQQLLDPNSLLAANRGYNLVLVRFEDWREAGMADSAARLAESVRGAAPRFHAPLLLAICPSAAGCAEASAAEQSLAQALAGLAGVSLLRPADVASLYPVAEIHDPHADELGHLPYTPLYFAALASSIARRIHALAAPPFKLVALDCDYVRSALQEKRARQAARPRSDFEHGYASERARAPRDPPRHVEVEDEVLTERFLRLQPASCKHLAGV